MAVKSSNEGQDAYKIVVLPDEGSIVPQYETQIILDVPKPLEHSISLDTILSSQKHLKSQIKVNREMENPNVYSPRLEDMDIEKREPDTPKTTDENVGNSKIEDSPTRTLPRQISLQMRGDIMQLLVDQTLGLPKFSFRDKSVPDRVHEMANNRPRKYKRSASFSSRKVVLLFSVLSSIGTLILIYLTLRVRQMADGSVHA